MQGNPVDEKVSKVLKVAMEFLAFDYDNLSSLAVKVNMSSSSVQRYLSNKKIIVDYLGEDVYVLIQDKLRRNKKRGNSRGGCNTLRHYTFVKGESGKFKGCIWQNSEDENEKRR